MNTRRVHGLLSPWRNNLPTSELQNACWGCAGEQLHACATSSSRQTNRTARVTKQLFAVQVIFTNALDSKEAWMGGGAKKRRREVVQLITPKARRLNGMRPENKKKCPGRPTSQNERCTGREGKLIPGKTAPIHGHSSRACFPEASGAALSRQAGNRLRPSSGLSQSARRRCGGQGLPSFPIVRSQLCYVRKGEYVMTHGVFVRSL